MPNHHLIAHSSQKRKKFVLHISITETHGGILPDEKLFGVWCIHSMVKTRSRLCRCVPVSTHTYGEESMMDVCGCTIVNSEPLSQKTLRKKKKMELVNRTHCEVQDYSLRRTNKRVYLRLF